MSRIKFKMIIIILLAFILYILHDINDGVKDANYRKLLSKVKIGMDSSDVILILNRPDECFRLSNKETEFRYFLDFYSSILGGEEPVVMIDTNGKVSAVLFID